MTVTLGPWKKRCSAKTKRTGKQCASWAVRGSNVCARHGAGGRPHPMEEGRPVNGRMKAAERIARLNERMVELGDTAMDAVSEVLRGVVIIDGIEMPNVDAKDRLKAAEMVLDRLIAKKLEMTDGKDDHRDIDGEIESELERIQFEMKNQRDAG